MSLVNIVLRIGHCASRPSVRLYPRAARQPSLVHTQSEIVILHCSHTLKYIPAGGHDETRDSRLRGAGTRRTEQCEKGCVEALAISAVSCDDAISAVSLCDISANSGLTSKAVGSLQRVSDGAQSRVPRLLEGSLSINESLEHVSVPLILG